MTLGTYNNFPPNIHFVQRYASAISTRQLQQKLVTFLSEVNREELSFEEVSIPTIPNGQVIFEFGIAEELDFNYLSAEEKEKTLALLARERVIALDFFCSIRYYREHGDKKQALKFDYYILRTVYGKDTFEIQVFHERGPLYLSPEDLVIFLSNGINQNSKSQILKETVSE